MAVAILKFLVLSWTRALHLYLHLHLHFSLGPPNYVAGPLQGPEPGTQLALSSELAAITGTLSLLLSEFSL